MATHKTFNEDGDGSGEENNNEETFLQGQQSPFPKQQKTTKNKQQKSISSRIRALERFIQNKGNQLPPSAITTKRVELEELRRIANARGKRKVEFKSSRRYHMIRFFERRKLERALEKEGPIDKQKLKELKRDLKYVVHFPKSKKYIGLFPKGGLTTLAKLEIDGIRKEIDRSLGHGDEDEKMSDEDDGDDKNKDKDEDRNEGEGDDVEESDKKEKKKEKKKKKKKNKSVEKDENDIDDEDMSRVEEAGDDNEEGEEESDKKIKKKEKKKKKSKLTRKESSNVDITMNDDTNDNKTVGENDNMEDDDFFLST